MKFLDYFLVTLLLLASIAYLFISLVPLRLRSKSRKTAGGCGGCGSCNTPTEVKVSTSSIGRRRF